VPFEAPSDYLHKTRENETTLCVLLIDLYFLMQYKFYKKKKKGCIECRDTGAKTKNIAIRNFLFVSRPTIKNRTRTKRYKIHAEPVRFLRPQAEAPEGNIANEARNVVDSPVY
jgi:hypothetical protein